jgi:hypothetical protein
VAATALRVLQAGRLGFSIVPEEAHPDLVSVGDVLHTVLVGYPVGGVITLWHDDGSATYWRVEHPDVLIAQLGLGMTARAEVASNRYREAGMFNPETTVLMLPSRYGDERGQIAAEPISLIATSQDVARSTVSATEPLDFYRQLGVIVLECARRGEFVAVETGGWEIPFAPFVLMAAIREPAGEWQSHVETGPVPHGAPVWSDQPQPGQDNEVQVLRAPATAENISAATQLAGLAIATWGLSLLELGLSFGPGPSGPWPG